MPDEDCGIPIWEKFYTYAFFVIPGVCIAVFSLIFLFCSIVAAVYHVCKNNKINPV